MHLKYSLIGRPTRYLCSLDGAEAPPVSYTLNGNRKMTEQASDALQYNLTQDYLEVARAALTQIHGKVPTGEEQVVPQLSNDLANAIFSVVSITIVYSFLALESFLNYQLFQLWAQRNDGSEESARFLSELGDVPEFVRLKGNDKVREVPARLKTICRLLGYPMPHEAIPHTWQRLNDLVEASRHFIVHPFPDTDYFNKNLRRMMTETTAGSYVGVIEEIISFLYIKSGRAVPAWVTENQLIRFRGLDLIPVQGRR